LPEIVFLTYPEEVSNEGSGSVEGVLSHRLFAFSLMHFKLTVTLFVEQGACVSYFLGLSYLSDSGIPCTGVAASVLCTSCTVLHT
jgi:hypothetical protein